MAFTSILVPTDFSDGSIAAVQLAVELAAIHTAAVTLLHIGVDPYLQATTGYGNTAVALSELAEQVESDIQAHLEKIQAEFIPDAIPSSIRLRQGFPPQEILEEVDEGGHDLVVMGTHGRTGLKRVLLGSVAERVIRGCPVPVLVTR
ncbi:MAG: nucleotide-binding universal stress UspA family protein [Myxococcota bacterium]|jgi:nucleotide-binding universal stress UspA family protein